MTTPGDPSSMKCRFYENKFPEVDELVVVRVVNIESIGAYVHLLEYNNAEGMILLSELTRRRIRSINKLIRVGKTECAMVLRVDKEKGYIDLSKRRVSTEDMKRCEDRFNKAMQVQQILRLVAEKEGNTLENLYETLGWPLARKYGTAYEGLKKILQNPEEGLAGFNLPEHTQQLLLKILKRRLTSPPKKIRADIEVTCFHYEGIYAIQAALRAGLAAIGDGQPAVKITLIASPLFVVVTTSPEEAPGIELVNSVVDAIRVEIEKHHGTLTVKEAARCVTEQDDKALEQEMEDKNKETRQVSGDNDHEDDASPIDAGEGKSATEE